MPPTESSANFVGAQLDRARWNIPYPPDPGPFRLAVTIEPSQINIGLHSHDIEELVLITAGSGIHLTETESYPIHVGDVIVVHPNSNHGYADTKGLGLINIIYEAQALPLPFAEISKVPGIQSLMRFAPDASAASPPMRLHLQPAEMSLAVEYAGQLRKELSRKRAGYEFFALAHFMEIIGLLCRWLNHVRPETSTTLRKLEKAVLYLDAHYTEPLDLGTLCRLAKMSRSTLFRSFKRVTGLAPLEYLIRLRLNRASDLLRRSTMSIKEIAHSTGFVDSNYFSRQYHTLTGESPRSTRSRLGFYSRK